MTDADRAANAVREMLKLPEELQRKVVDRINEKPVYRHFKAPGGPGFWNGLRLGRPFLTALKQPIMDSVILTPGFSKSTLFSDCRNFDDGTPKTETDVNFHMPYQLGTPLEYDLRWLEMHVVDYADAEDVRKVLASVVGYFIFGGSIVHLNLPLGAWRPYLDIGEKRADVAIREAMEAFEKRGGIWPWYRHPFTPIEAPRHITSTESFRLELYCRPEPLGTKAPVKLRILMQDTLWGAI